MNTLWQLWLLTGQRLADGLGSINVCRPAGPGDGSQSKFVETDANLGASFKRIGRRIDSVEGEVQIVGLNGVPRAAKAGGTILPGEQVIMSSKEFPSLSRTVDPFPRGCEPTRLAPEAVLQTVESTSGDVTVQRAGRKEHERLQAGDQLGEGDIIHIAKKSGDGVTLKDKNGNDIRIQRGVQATISASTATGIELIDELQRVVPKLLPEPKSMIDRKP